MSARSDQRVKKEHADSDDDMPASATQAKVRKEILTYEGAMDVADDDDIVQNDNGPSDWPENYSYVKDAPTSVPFGPPTMKIWETLSDAPLFAHPNDTAGIEREESDSTFLIQFPTSVILGSNNPRARRNAGNDEEGESVDLTSEKNIYNISESMSDSTSMSAQATHFTEFLKEQKLSAGKIGKLQITESGKVFLVCSNGLRYELHAGLSTCFSQYVAAVDCTESIAASDSRVKMEPGLAESVQSAPANGATASMFMLAPITRKLIVAPSF